VVSKTVPPEPNKVSAASEPLQPDKIVTAMPSMMLRKMTTTQDKVGVRQKKRQAVTSNDVDEETEGKDDLEDYEDAGYF
jgi:hypothetical protein